MMMMIIIIIIIIVIIIIIINTMYGFTLSGHFLITSHN